jgi:hypothetical protein
MSVMSRSASLTAMTVRRVSVVRDVVRRCKGMVSVI